MTRLEALGPGPEFDLIREITRELEDHPNVLVGPGDDAAVITGGLILSCDASVEDVHFRRDWLSAEEIGFRAAAVALSDLAAMAARPLVVLTSLILPRRDYGDFALLIMHGVQRAAEQVEAVLAGGDTTHTNGPLTIDVTAVGSTIRPVLRSGAQRGDEVWVTGNLGGAAAAVAAWKAGSQPGAAARTAFAAPIPRVREAQWLVDQCELHALIDLSDGLIADLQHIAAASDVGILVHGAAVPIHPELQSSVAALDLALAGGDDYELCFAAAPGTVDDNHIRAFHDDFGVPLTRIGEVEAGSRVRVIGPDGQPLQWARAGYDHFAEQQ